MKSHTQCGRVVPELIPVHGQLARGDRSRQPAGRLPLLSARPAVTLLAAGQSSTALWPVPNYTAWWQKHVVDVNDLPRVAIRSHASTEVEPATLRSRSDALRRVINATPIPFKLYGSLVTFYSFRLSSSLVTVSLTLTAIFQVGPS